MLVELFFIFTVITGVASQYDPGVMQGVIRTRQAGRTSYNLPQDLPNVDGYVATAECNEIGHIKYIRPIGQDKWETFLVVDCAAPPAYRWMKGGTRIDGEWYPILVEVDAETVKRWGAPYKRAVLIEVRGILHIPNTSWDTWDKID